MELSFLLLFWGLSDSRIAELRKMPQSFSNKFLSETQVSGCLGMSEGRSPRHAQNPLLGERKKTLSISRIAMYCTALHCIVLWAYCIALHCIALHCIALYCIALHCITLFCNKLHSIALLCIALHCTVLYCIALHYIVLYYTAVVFTRYAQLAFCKIRTHFYIIRDRHHCPVTLVYSYTW